MKTVSVFTPTKERAALFEAGGITPFSVIELDSSEAGVFHAAISASKENNPHAASVYVYDVEDYAGMRLFLSDDGASGFALKGDELVSVFKGDTPHKRVAHNLVHLAVEQGARRGDAFDTVLPVIYGHHGLETVARVQWSEKEKPKGWRKRTFKDFNNGEPDVIFMRFREDYTADYKPGQGRMFESYDDAYESTKAMAAKQQT